MTLKRTGAVALLAIAALQGCATLTDSNEQEVTVRAILDHREVANVGCVLSNNVGRWFVNAPGRVTIRKSEGNLVVDCKKAGVGAATETVASRFGTGNLIGNAVTSGGLGYLVDRHSGAGFDYPVMLTVLMRGPAAAAGDTLQVAGVGNQVY
jgi:enoyl-[acyl-carrier-protein] reductase (NADH)